MAKTKKDCESFDENRCEFYASKCFHDDSTDHPNRCYRLFPRQEGEFMEWMTEICSDCNEPVCDDCERYGNYLVEIGAVPSAF
jgi:hypothetical protein